MGWNRQAQRKRSREKNAKRPDKHAKRDEQAAARRRVTDLDGNILAGKPAEEKFSAEHIVLAMRLNVVLLDAIPTACRVLLRSARCPHPTHIIANPS